MVSVDERELGEMPDEPVTDPEIAPELVNSSIRELPDKARVIFTLFCVEGYKHKEIAEMLRITESTSKTQYHRARLMLQQKVKEKLYERQPGVIH